ncbi:MAG: CPBP family intramembrane metalloprotease [Chitinophagaceae bacterium]|nr:CPBP family intramembrane metalloprotease [Chitinophagaceae bacterium]
MLTTFKSFVLTILAIGIVTIVPHTGIIPFPFGYVIPVLLFIWLYLKFNKENFQSIGFDFKTVSWKSFLIGAITGLLLFLFMVFVFFPLLKYAVHLPESRIDFYEQLKGNTAFYLFLVLMGWLVGGLYEEIVFHGFIFTCVEKLVPGKAKLPISFLFTNVVFALYHFQLGYDGVINALIAGSCYHVLILVHKRNLWYGIFCHAIFDTIALTALYWGYK